MRYSFQCCVFTLPCFNILLATEIFKLRCNIHCFPGKCHFNFTSIIIFKWCPVILKDSGQCKNPFLSILSDKTIPRSSFFPPWGLTSSPNVLDIMEQWNKEVQVKLKQGLKYFFNIAGREKAVVKSSAFPLISGQNNEVLDCPGKHTARKHKVVGITPNAWNSVQPVQRSGPVSMTDRSASTYLLN